MKNHFLILLLSLVPGVGLHAQTAETSTKAEAAQKGIEEYFSFMFFDAGAAAEFNLVYDNFVAGYIGNRKLRQTIDFVKKEINTGVCVHCYIDSGQRWAKILNIKKMQGNCDTLGQGKPSLVFDIALKPLGADEPHALFRPVITYRATPAYDKKLKPENIADFEQYMRDTLPPMRRGEFLNKLNDRVVTALLKLMGMKAPPVTVELLPLDAYGYDNYPAPAIYYAYEQTQLHGNNKIVYWASIPKNQSLKVRGAIREALPDSTKRTLQLKRNSSVLQNFSSKDSTVSFTVNGFKEGDNTLKAVYQLADGKGVDILAGQVNVAAYKEEKLKLTIVPVKGGALSQTQAVKDALNKIYRQAVVEWDITVDNSFNYTKNIAINPESNYKDPYDATMLDVIKEYKKTGGYSKKSRYIFLVDKFSTGAATDIGYMPFFNQFGFVKALGEPEKLARWIAHELGHGAFGLEHTMPLKLLPPDNANLMDYGDSTRLCKFQWDIIHNSNAGTKEFDGAEEVMLRSDLYPSILNKLILRNYCYSYALEEPLKGQLLYRTIPQNISYVASYKNMIPFTDHSGKYVSLLPTKEKTEELKQASNMSALWANAVAVYNYADSADIKITHALKKGLQDCECPRIFDINNKNDFAIELIHALKLAAQGNKMFTHVFEKNDAFDIGVLDLPNGNKITDVTIFINTDKQLKINPLNYETFEDKHLFSKNDTYLCFGEKVEDKKYPLMIKVNTSDFPTLMEYLLNVNPSEIPTYNVDDIMTATNDATNDADNFKCGSCCNVCTRSAIWRIAGSSILFATSGGWLGSVNKSHYLYGKAEGFSSATNAAAGQANSIYLSLENGKMAEFEQTLTMDGSTIPDFTAIQKMANNGMIVIGVLKEDSGSGHVVMVTPYNEDLSKDSGNYDYRKIEGIEVLMPRILECGGSRRNTSCTLQAGVASAKIKNMKWYKMIKVYTSEKNKLYNNP